MAQKVSLINKSKKNHWKRKRYEARHRLVKLLRKLDLDPTYKNDRWVYVSNSAVIMVK